MVFHEQNLPFDAEQISHFFVLLYSKNEKDFFVFNIFTLHSLYINTGTTITVRNISKLETTTTHQKPGKSKADVTRESKIDTERTEKCNIINKGITLQLESRPQALPVVLRLRRITLNVVKHLKAFESRRWILTKQSKTTMSSSWKTLHLTRRRNNRCDNKL